MEYIVDAIKEVLYTVLYKLFSSICILIDFIKTIFYKLCGIDTVIIDGQEGDVLTSIISSQRVKESFLIIFLISFILMVIFSCIAIIRCNYIEKKNYKSVLSKLGQSFLIVLLLPFLVFAGIVMTNAIMTAVNMAMNGGVSNGVNLIGGQFLVTIGNDAYIGGKPINEIENMFISGQLDYSKLSVVKQYYDFQNLNYFIGIFGSIIILVSFVLSSLTFIQRIFDVVLLYIISPISASTIPLDDGVRFKTWKDLFLSKLISAYGVILVMNLFFMIIPQIYNIRFFDNNFQNGIVHILFLIGGSFSVSKANRVIAQLCGSGRDDGEFLQMVKSIYLGTHLTKSAGTLIAGGAMGLMAGSEYKQARKKGKSTMQSLLGSFKGESSRRKLSDAEVNKKKQFGFMPLRLASMPIGVLKDLHSGGIVRASKNFIPRCRNLFQGDTMKNYADIKTKPIVNEPTKEKLEVNSNNIVINKNLEGGTNNENNTKD